MKFFLTAIVLLSLSQYAVADATLNYRQSQADNKPSSFSYLIKDQRLRVNESGSERINLFKQPGSEFISYNPQNQQLDLINPAVLKTRVDTLDQQRHQRIEQIETELQQKLTQMSEQEREIGEALLNQIKYPAFYGEHTQIRVIPLKDHKTVAGIECRVYQLVKQKQRIKEFCMAPAEALGLSPKDYQTLRSFYAFEYSMISQLMLAMGKSDFTVIDYDSHDMPGVVIEAIEFKQQQINQHTELDSYNSDPLQTEQLSLPENPAVKPAD
jgi:hypothetical protein